MPYDLTSMASAQGRRRSIALRPIVPTRSQANELARIMAPAWQVWSNGLKTILAGYDPAPLASDGDTLIRDGISEITAAINQIGNEFLTRLVVEITPDLRRWALRSEQIHRSRWVAAVNAGAGIDLSMMLTAQPVQETLEAFIARNVALAKDVSAQAQSRLSDIVFRGYQSRIPIRQVAKEMNEAVGLGRQRAVRIAADQNSKLSAALDADRQAEAGIDKFKYRHSGKLHPRAWHRARDGRIYDWRTRKEIGGTDVIAADDMPGMPPWCGCRTQAWIDLAGEID